MWFHLLLHHHLLKLKPSHRCLFVFSNPFKAIIDIMLAAKAGVKAVPVPVEQALAVGYEGDIAGEEDHFYSLANLPSPAIEVSVSHAENDSMQGKVHLE